MDHVVVKHLWAFGAGILAVFAPVQTTIVAAGVLVLADLVTGCFAAVKRGERIRSDKLRKTVVKLLVYETAICLGFIGETYLLGGTVPVVKLASALIGVVELKSVLENLDAITGGAVFKTLIERLAPANVAKNGPRA